MAYVARAIGVSASKVSTWEKGSQFPNDTEMLKLCILFKVTRSEFIGKEPVDSYRAHMEFIDDSFIKGEDPVDRRLSCLDEVGNNFKEFWTLELSPAIWKMMKDCMDAKGYAANEVDEFLQSIIAEDYRKRFLIDKPEKPIIADGSN